MSYPSPYLHAIVGFLSRAIACIMFPSSHAAAFVYPLLASVASIIASSHSLAPLFLSLSSPASSEVTVCVRAVALRRLWLCVYYAASARV